MKRRNFLRTAAAASVAFAAPSFGQTFPAGRFVDVHVHLTQRFGLKRQLTAKLLLEWMDEHEVAQACVLPLISPESWDHPIPTEYVLDETKPHRDRLIPWCVIDPRTINLGGYDKFRGLLERYVEAGAKGFGEHKTGVPIDHPKNMELYRACGELGLPVLFHLDTHRNTDAPGLPGLAHALEAFPQTNFIGHAQGWWASISGGVTADQLQRYPEGKVAPGGAIDALMDRYPNIYGDLSAGSGLNAIIRDADFGREFVIRRQDRLLFGTDYLEPGQGVRQFEVYDGFDLPGDVQRKVFRDNARRLMGLI